MSRVYIDRDPEELRDILINDIESMGFEVDNHVIEVLDNLIEYLSDEKPEENTDQEVLYGDLDEKVSEDDD